MPTPEPDQQPDGLSPDEREVYYLPSEVAGMFDVTVETIADWCARGILVAVSTNDGESRILASSLKGGRAYDEMKAAFIERMARKRAGAQVPDGETIAQTLRESRRIDGFRT